MITEWIRCILEQKKEDNPLLEWLVEDQKVFKLLDHYRVMTSKFKIEKYSKLLNCSSLSSTKNRKMEDTFVLKGAFGSVLETDN